MLVVDISLYGKTTANQAPKLVMPSHNILGLMVVTFDHIRIKTQNSAQLQTKEALFQDNMSLTLSVPKDEI